MKTTYVKEILLEEYISKMAHKFDHGVKILKILLPVNLMYILLDNPNVCINSILGVS